MDARTPVVGGNPPSPGAMAHGFDGAVAIDDQRWANAAAAARPRRRRLVIAVLLLTVVGAVLATGVQARRPSPAAIRDEGPAPTFDLPRLGAPEERVSLAASHGAPVVVNFWASWCVPCRKEMPALERVYERVRGRVAFVGVNHEDGRTPAMQFQAELGVRYPSGYDPRGRVADAYRLYGLPTTVFVDARGRIVARKVGKLDEQELEDFIRRAFGVETPGSSA